MRNSFSWGSSIAVPPDMGFCVEALGGANSIRGGWGGKPAAESLDVNPLAVQFFLADVRWPECRLAWMALGDCIAHRPSLHACYWRAKCLKALVAPCQSCRLRRLVVLVDSRQGCWLRLVVVERIRPACFTSATDYTLGCTQAFAQAALQPTGQLLGCRTWTRLCSSTPWCPWLFHDDDPSGHLLPVIAGLALLLTLTVYHDVGTDNPFYVSSRLVLPNPDGSSIQFPSCFGGFTCGLGDWDWGKDQLHTEACPTMPYMRGSSRRVPTRSFTYHAWGRLTPTLLINLELNLSRNLWLAQSDLTMPLSEGGTLRREAEAWRTY
jgi:hypothetical protein